MAAIVDDGVSGKSCPEGAATGTSPASLFEGAGPGASPEGVSKSMLLGGGAGAARSPEVTMRASDGQCPDAWGRPMVTAAQVYASSDAWAAARMMWEILAQQAQGASADLMVLPDNTTWYPDGAIPGLPTEAGCPDALEAVLRGLLQSRPEDRLPPEEAVRALHASLYGPVGVEEAAAVSGGMDASFEWVRDQRMSLWEVEHAVPPLPLASLVGASASAAREEEMEASRARDRVSGQDVAASGAGAGDGREWTGIDGGALLAV